ncbi:MAG: ABC transporter substrate-binding protein [Gammaproteobacteria bacterium]|nr:ABC transporter substrate-binding protein [Gammaproteobacteria bacterium]
MKKLKYWLVTGLTTGVLATALAGGAGAAGLEKVNVVGSSWPGHAPQWMAIDNSYFEKAGFDVTFRMVAGSMDRVAVISSGDAVFGGMGAAAMVPAMAQGNRNFYWVGSPDAARAYSGIVAKKEIKSLNDLKGKKLAVQFGGSEEVTDYYLLQTVGMDMYNDVQLVNMRQSEMLQALSQGLIDAAGAWSPEFERLQKIEGTHVIATVDDLGFFEKYRQMPVPDVLLINKEWTDQDPQRAKRFLCAYFKGMDYVMANPKETSETAIKYTKQPADVYSVAANKFNWLPREAQAVQLSDKGAYPVIDKLIAFMHDQVQKIDNKPDYREWVRADLVTGECPN